MRALVAFAYVFSMASVPQFGAARAGDTEVCSPVRLELAFRRASSKADDTLLKECVRQCHGSALVDDSLLALATFYYNKKDYRACVEICDRLIKVFPKGQRTYVPGWIEPGRGHSRASPLCAYLKKHPDRIDHCSLLLRARGQLALGDRNQAIRALEELVESAKNGVWEAEDSRAGFTQGRPHREAVMFLIDLKTEDGQFDDAWRIYRDRFLAFFYPTRYQFKQRFARALVAAGWSERALFLIRSAIEEVKERIATFPASPVPHVGPLLVFRGSDDPEILADKNRWWAYYRDEQITILRKALSQLEEDHAKLRSSKAEGMDRLE